MHFKMKSAYLRSVNCRVTQNHNRPFSIELPFSCVSTRVLVSPRAKLTETSEMGMKMIVTCLWNTFLHEWLRIKIRDLEDSAP